MCVGGGGEMFMITYSLWGSVVIIVLAPGAI